MSTLRSTRSWEAALIALLLLTLALSPSYGFGQAWRPPSSRRPASISLNDVADGLSKAIGKRVTYVDVPTEAAREALIGMGMSEWIADGYIELFEGFSKGFVDLTTLHVERLTGDSARSSEAFAGDFAQAFGGST